MSAVMGTNGMKLQICALLCLPCQLLQSRLRCLNMCTRDKADHGVCTESAQSGLLILFLGIHGCEIRACYVQQSTAHVCTLLYMSMQHGLGALHESLKGEQVVVHQHGPCTLQHLCPRIDWCLQGTDSNLVVKNAYAKYNLSLGVGLTKVAGKVFRIGHLGNMDEVMLLGALAGTEMALTDAGIKVQPGSGVGEAIKYFQETSSVIPTRAAPEKTSM